MGDKGEPGWPGVLRIQQEEELQEAAKHVSDWIRKYGLKGCCIFITTDRVSVCHYDDFRPVYECRPDEGKLVKVVD